MLNRRDFIKMSSMAALGFVFAGYGENGAAAGIGNADLVIYGNFYTVDDKNPKAEAVAIKDGKFVYVGAAAGVKNFIGKNTKQ